jgi:hypothetical protein
MLLDSLIKEYYEPCTTTYHLFKYALGNSVFKHIQTNNIEILLSVNRQS